MLIHLDSSAISSAIGEGEDADKSLRTVERLLERHQECHHILSIDDEDAQRLRAAVKTRLSRHQLDTLEQIQARWFADILPLRDRLHRHLVLGFGQQFEEKRDGRAVRLNLHKFYDLDTSGRSVLLCENATDVDLYIALGRLSLRRSGWGKRLLIHCDPRSGGGSQLGRELERIAKEGRLLLAIVDSDRKCPEGAIGDTARAARSAAKNLPELHREFQVTHVLRSAREAENLIPLRAYEEAFRHLPGGRQLQIDRIAQLREIHLQPEEHRHTDLKRGIRLFQVQRKMQGKPEQTLWSELAVRRGRETCSLPEPCADDRAEKDCACWVVEPLGEKILEDFVGWLPKAIQEKPLETWKLLDLDETWVHERQAGEEREIPEIVEIAEKVIAWGCAYPRLET